MTATIFLPCSNMCVFNTWLLNGLCNTPSEWLNRKKLIPRIHSLVGQRNEKLLSRNTEMKSVFLFRSNVEIVSFSLVQRSNEFFFWWCDLIHTHSGTRFFPFGRICPISISSLALCFIIRFSFLVFGFYFSFIKKKSIRATERKNFNFADVIM